MAAQQETRQQEPGQETGQQEIPQQGTPLCLTPIGRVVRDAGTTGVRIDPPYRAGLRELGGFSHVLVLWWAGRYDDEDHRRTVVVPLPYAEDREAGVFACRSPARPNPVMTTVCAVESVDEETGVVRLGALDAFDDTPVVDLKPYYGVTDRVRSPRIPDYLVGWPEWFPEEGIGLMPDES
ncbi:MAG: SAM-dependent methyltransferase [Actinomycetales bacterium]|nr:SAM-dependent methyltransferase [Actinomycetales bacterium]